MRRGVTLLLLGSLALGCATVSYPYPLREPMWVDHDGWPFGPAPSELYNPPRWDSIDQTVFRQLAELWLLELDREAINVNALDEVPVSSWFDNRIGLHEMTPATLAQGACSSADDPPLPWTIVRAKTAGSSPGFVIRAADERTYLFKVDFDQPERGTAADAIGTRLYWAAGYHTPCNRVVRFDRGALVLSTERRPGRAPPTEAEVRRVLAQAGRTPDGRYRGSLSEYIEGSPLGGWRFDGLRADDRNDVVPHQHRREVRGMRVLAAWTNHIDARAENNFDAWIEAGDGRGYVRHYVLDVGDSFGITLPGSELLSQSFGVTHYLDLQHLTEDFLTLGVIERPYFGVSRGPAGHVLGYFDVERFDPDGWRNGYPNPAFERATERDLAWMARIVARFREEHVRAAVRIGYFSDPRVEQELVRILLGRRTRILERYLTRLSPLSMPTVDGDRLCLHDLAVEGGLRDARARRYAARAFAGWPARAHSRPVVQVRGTEACVAVPSADPDPSHPAYWIVDLVAETVGAERTAPARVHLYELGPRDYRIVGLERPAGDAPP